MRAIRACCSALRPGAAGGARGAAAGAAYTAAAGGERVPKPKKAANPIHI